MQITHIKKSAIKIDNTSLNYVRFGTGETPLVLLPGLSFQNVKNAAFPLAYMYRMFAKKYTIYVFDKKAVIPDGYTIKNMADDIAQAMEELHLENADVFGVSQGGMIAQYLAVNYPHLVHKLVLGVTASRCNEVMETVLNDWIKMSRQGDYGGIVADMFPKMYSAAYLKRYKCLIPILSRVGKPKDFTRFIALARACLTCDSYSDLPKINCPVFVIGGKSDLVVTGRASEEIADKLHCQIYMYDELGHAAYEEAADFNERVFQFLNDG